MKFDRKYIIKHSIDNFILGGFLSFFAAFLSGVYDVYILLAWILSFFVSWAISLLIPAGKICNFVGGLFKFKPDSFLSNLVGGIVTNLYYSPIITFSCKLLIFLPDFNMAIEQFLKYAVIMYLVSFVVYQIIFNITNLIFYNNKESKEG